MTRNPLLKVQAFLSLAEKDLFQARRSFPNTGEPLDKLADLIQELHEQVADTRKLVQGLCQQMEDEVGD